MAALAGSLTLLLWGYAYADRATPPSDSTAADTTAYAPPEPRSQAGTLGLLPYRPAKWVKKQIEDKSCMFLFAVIGDPHLRVAGAPDERYLKDMEVCGQVLANCVHDMNRHSPSVDFAVELGDLADLGTTDEFAMASEVFDSLRCPLYPVFGNHDAFQNDHKAAWKAFAGRDSTDYSFNFLGFHFIVIDCTLDPYAPPYVNCDSTLRRWVQHDLALNHGMPTIVFSHYNMWLRHWNPMFDTTLVYAEYQGMPELRHVLEDAGNVVAVVNGHVHANRAEKHNGIYYLDVGATIVGPPSIRYFYVYPDRIEVTYSYISDQGLFDHVTGLCPHCLSCFNPSKVCAFIDGQVSDKQLIIPLHTAAGIVATPADSSHPATLALAVKRDDAGQVRALISSELTGVVEVSIHDVLGRRLARCSLWKDKPGVDANLTSRMPVLSRLPAGAYFVRAYLGGSVRTAKLILVP